MSSHRRIASVMSAAVALALIAGCSSSSDKAGGSSAAPSSDASSSTSTAASSPASSSASSAASGELQGALLAPTDVGTGFTVRPGDTQPDSPLPCTPDAKPLFTQFPTDQRVKQGYGNSGDTLAVNEEIAAYDAATAKQVIAAAIKGFACSSGTLGGSTVKIVKRPSAGSTADVESAAWDFVAGDTLGTAAIIRIKNRIVAMSFAATKASANDINVATVLEKAATKVAALG